MVILEDGTESIHHVDYIFHSQTSLLLGSMTHKLLSSSILEADGADPYLRGQHFQIIPAFLVHTQEPKWLQYCMILPLWYSLAIDPQVQHRNMCNVIQYLY